MSALKLKPVNRKTIYLICGVILFGLLSVGGYYAYNVYQYRQTAAYTVERLKQALNPPNPSELAKLVDFASVSGDLASAIAKTFPFFLAGKDQQRNIRDALQKAFLANLTGQDTRRYEPDENEAKDLLKPLIILPPDFNVQITQNLSQRENGADSVILTTKVDNPQLGQPVPLIFNLRHEKNGWIVKNFLNASELTQRVREILLKRHARLREVYEEKNAATRKKMDSLLPVLSCTADGGLLSNGKIYILMVHVLARNMGLLQANNFSMDVAIKGKNGEMIERRFLNAAKPVGPGEDFNHRWSFELDSQGKLAQEFMAQTPLSCSAQWQTLGLSNSQVWHIEEVPNPDRACLIEGHSHPEGFCIIPIFQP